MSNDLRKYVQCAIYIPFMIYKTANRQIHDMEKEKYYVNANL